MAIASHRPHKNTIACFQAALCPEITCQEARISWLHSPFLPPIPASRLPRVTPPSQHVRSATPASRCPPLDGIAEREEEIPLSWLPERSHNRWFEGSSKAKQNPPRPFPKCQTKVQKKQLCHPSI